MFKHPGKKLKITALAIAMLGAVVSVALGAAILAGAVKVNPARRLLYGAGIPVGGLALSWVAGLALHGFGELIDKTKDNNYMLSRIASHTKDMLEDRNIPKK